MENTIDTTEVQEITEAVQNTLSAFGNKATIENVIPGLNLVSFHLGIKSGVQVSAITKLTDDFTSALAGRKVRFQTAVQGVKGIVLEVPTSKRAIVTLGEVLPEVPHDDNKLFVAVGKKTNGETLYLDLSTAPHLLIAGRTGSGKSVAVNTILTSILEKYTPQQVQLALIDPKMVELTPYKTCDHVNGGVATSPQDALMLLKGLVSEMNLRKEALMESASRNIVSHRNKGHEMPYVVCVIDELANLMLSDVAKDIEANIAILTAEARAFGIHMILATQRPSVDVITGVIKANVPTRMAFAVTTEVDSRVIIDQTGAEALLGKGDMLLFVNDQTTRAQGCFVSEDEMDAIISKHSNKKTTQATPKATQIVTEDDVKAETKEPTMVESFIANIFKTIVNETVKDVKTKGGLQGFVKTMFH